MTLFAGAVCIGTAAAGQPPLKFDEKTLYLGECDQGEVARRTIVFTNAGSIAVRLTEARGSCACTAADLPVTAIPPGERGTFTASIKTANRIGKYESELTLVCDCAGAKLSTKIKLSVLIRAEGKLVAEPDTIYLGAMAAGEVIHTTAAIRYLQYAQVPTAIQNITAPKWLRARLEPLATPDRGWRLDIDGTVPDASGLVYGRVVLETDSARFPQLEIPLVLTIDGNFIREPQSVVQVLRRDAPQNASRVVVRHAKGTAWRLIDYDVEGFDRRDLKIDFPDDGLSAEKSILVSAPEMGRGFSVKRGALVLKTTCGDKTESVRVPLLFIRKK